MIPELGVGWSGGGAVVVLVGLVGCAESEGEVGAPVVVPGFDPPVQVLVQLGGVVPAVTVDQFAFQCCEERFGPGVIPTLSGQSKIGTPWRARIMPVISPIEALRWPEKGASRLAG